MLLDYFPVFLMAGVVTLLGLFILKISSLLRPANPYPAKSQPYECGVDPVGDASVGQVKIHYFVIAIVFIIFDVETLYLFPWAVVLREIGWFGFGSMMVFLGILVVGFIYEWKKGALDWE